MDIFGIRGVEAEGELLSAAVQSLQRMGLSSSHVGIKVLLSLIQLSYINDLSLKVNSRKLLQKMFSIVGR